MERVLLFDIDQTLLYTGGAGGMAMNLAFQELFGVNDGFARVEFSGRTDRYILQEGLACHGIDGGYEQHLQSFILRYYQVLPQTLRQRPGFLMPGLPELLQALAAEPGVRMGLATGNFSRAARIKLDYYGLSEYFRQGDEGALAGGFGEESADRSEVVRQAVSRTAKGARLGDVLVIGDTPHDVRAALDNRVVAVGVATGNYSVDELEAAGAHLVFPDFADWQAAVKKLLAPVSASRS